MDDQTYEINIKRFMTSIDHQLKKLKECVNRLNEFQYYEDWTNVKQAYLNCIQIIKRIKEDITSITSIRKDIVSNLEDKSSNPIVNKIDQELNQIIGLLLKQQEEIDSISAPYYKFELNSRALLESSGYFGSDMLNYHVEKNEYIAQDTELCGAYDQLQKENDKIKTLLEKFSEEINKPSPTIDSIERNVLESGKSSNLSIATKSIGTASCGALIGMVVGGPVGLFAGLKLGVAIGLGSSVVGYYIARRLK